jgi:hypothetical protein
VTGGKVSIDRKGPLQASRRDVDGLAIEKRMSNGLDAASPGRVTSIFKVVIRVRDQYIFGAVGVDEAGVEGGFLVCRQSEHVRVGTRP